MSIKMLDQLYNLILKTEAEDVIDILASLDKDGFIASLGPYLDDIKHEYGLQNESTGDEAYNWSTLLKPL